MISRIPAISAALFLLSGAPSALATLPPNAPSLSVHETAYGTTLNGTHQESIQTLAIRIASHAGRQGSDGAGTEFEVQCFFLKRGKPGDLPTVDDTVIFEVTNPHGTYIVEAKPISMPRLPGGAKPAKSKSSGKSSRKSSPKAALPSPGSPPTSPREGYVVRVFCKGVLLRQECSSHQIERLLREHPELPDEAATKKSIRFVEAGTLLKKH
jgi:hypothetical protein